MTRNKPKISLLLARGGWALVEGVPDLTVMARYRPGPGNRLRAQEVYVSVQGDKWLDVATWRSVPIAEAETLANLPEKRKVIIEHIDDLDADVSIGTGAKDAQPVLQVRRTRHDLRLPRPQGRRFPDEFYKRVADAYRSAVERGEAPGQMIAAVNRVPATTTRRWFAEARRRGFLEPAQGMGRTG